METENLENEKSTMKTADRTKYMREYKREQYLKNPEEIKGKNKAYYYKHKHNLTSEDMKKYDIHLPIVARIWKNLDDLKEKQPELIEELLNNYLSKLKL